MSTLNCYGNEKKKIIQKYDIKPIMYIGLLANQEKNGCCGKLKKEYYILEATDKTTKTKFSFYAGKSCAEQILKIIKLEPLTYFNPFKSKKGNTTQDPNPNIIKSNNQSINLVNKELLNAIYLISMAWNTPPPISILHIIDFTNKLNEQTINKMGVLWVNDNLDNDNLDNDKKKRTLSKIYSDLKKQNPSLRKLEFENLKNKMTELYPDIENRY